MTHSASDHAVIFWRKNDQLWDSQTLFMHLQAKKLLLVSCGFPWPVMTSYSLVYFILRTCVLFLSIATFGSHSEPAGLCMSAQVLPGHLWHRCLTSLSLRQHVSPAAQLRPAHTHTSEASNVTSCWFFSSKIIRVCSFVLRLWQGKMEVVFKTKRVAAEHQQCLHSCTCQTNVAACLTLSVWTHMILSVNRPVVF